MPEPTCATCHLSGLNGQAATHDTTERLSWLLYAPISTKRDGYQRGQHTMQATCRGMSTAARPWSSSYIEAEAVVHEHEQEGGSGAFFGRQARAEGLLTPAPFDEELEFLEFDMWHYYGRTAKHGAFMGGADFVQWHGNYELLHYQTKLEEAVAALRGTEE